jgi:hypothetical protein
MLFAATATGSAPRALGARQHARGRSPEGGLGVVTPDSDEPTGVEAQPTGADSRVVWVIVVWARVVMGLILGAVGGVAFGHAWTNNSAPWWWVGGVSLLGGVLLLLSGLYARSHPPGVTPDIVVREAAPSEQDFVVPLLGALLIYKYQCLTHRQLDEALQEQRQQGANRRLIGQILVDKGAITAAQLDTALEHQRALAREKLEREQQPDPDPSTPPT